MSDKGEHAPLTVLIVDDEEIIRELARHVLERAGLTVLDEAENGVVALERYRRHDPPKKPRVVLMDNRMPGRSGLDVAAEMLEAFPTQIVVLFSAHLDQSIRARARDLGVSACVSKNDVTKLPGILDDLVAAS
jgi:CheY-like chemotaxis protein